MKSLALEVADKYDISTTTLFNLIESESKWNPKALGDMNIDCKQGVNAGKPVRARGLAQITDCYNASTTDEEAFDPEYALEFAAKQIKRNEGNHYVSCNCVAFVRAMGVHFPRLKDAKDLDVNSKVPVKGGVVQLDYNGIYHLAYITSVEADGIHVREANFKPCLSSRRVIDFNDPRIVGYFREVID